MPPAADLLLDTSIAVPALVADHEHHAPALRLVTSNPVSLAGHAWFETYSVLTRLPGAIRRTGPEALELMRRAFLGWTPLPISQAEVLLEQFARADIVGGAVYDALVGAAAAAAGRPLATMDRRAASTYLAVGAEARLLVP
ncbi:MAG: PIN domain-containing protein [Pseudonocardiaceae bacterium]